MSSINANNNGRIFVINANCNIHNLTFINGVSESYIKYQRLIQ